MVGVTVEEHFRSDDHNSTNFNIVMKKDKSGSCGVGTKLDQGTLVAL